MSYLDDLAGVTPSQKAKQQEASKQTSISSGKSYLDTLAGTQEPVIPANEPTLQLPKFEVPSVQSAIKKAPALTPEQSIATGYDMAQNKWEYKRTLTDTELNTLSKLRPESKSVGSTPIYTPPTPDYLKPRPLTETDLSIAKAYESAPDKLKYKQSLTNTELVSLLRTHPESEQLKSKSIYTPEQNISYLPGAELKQGGKTKPESFADYAFSTIYPGVDLQVTRDYEVNALLPAWNKVVGSISATEVSPEEMKKSWIEDRAPESQPASIGRKIQKGAVGLIEVIFSPLTFASQKISSENPNDLTQPGNLLNKIVSAPFELSKNAIKVAMSYDKKFDKNGKLVPYTEAEKDDIATIVATLLPFAKSKTKAGMDITTIRDMANTVYKKTSEMTPEMKKVYKQGALELHPDASGLADTFFVRFNEAAMRGDTVAMKSVLEEGRKAKAANPQAGKFYDNTTEMRKDAQKGNENAIIRDNQYKEAVKVTPVEVKDAEGKPVVTIETAKYDDGVVTPRITIVDNQNNSTTIPFEGEYQSTPEAVAAAAEQAKEVIAQAPENYSPETVAAVEKVAEAPKEVIKGVDKKTETKKDAKSVFDEMLANNKNILKLAEQNGIEYSKTELEPLDRVVAKYGDIPSMSEFQKSMAEKYGYKDVYGLHKLQFSDFIDLINIQEFWGGFTLMGSKGKFFKTGDEIESRGMTLRQIYDSDTSEVLSPITQPTYANGSQIISDTGKVSEGKGGGGGEKPYSPVTGGRGAPSIAQPGQGPVGTTPTGTRFTKSGRSALNLKARQILESKNYSTSATDYTVDELNTLKEYSGAGGKAVKGEAGRGLLDEYYTPKPIVKAMWELAKKHGEVTNVLEPSAGIGRFLEHAPSESKVTAHEIDKTSGTIAKILHPDKTVKIGDFQELFMDKSGKKIPTTPTYDLIIGNPPYGARAGFMKGLGEEKSIAKWDEYFIKRSFDLIKDNGNLVFIIPSSFLDGKPSKVKEIINATLVDAYRMPKGVFEDTEVGTDIIVLKKTPGDQAMLSNGEFFKANPNKILGSVEQVKDRFGKMVSEVKGNKEEALKKLEEMVGKAEVKPTEMREAPVEKKKPTEAKQVEGRISRVKKEPKKVVDVSGIKTIEKQVLNYEMATEAELAIFKNQRQDLSVRIDGEVPTEWAPYLNYYNGEWYHDINYFSGDIRAKLDELAAHKNRISEAQYQKQQTGLLKVLPKEKAISEIMFDPLDRYVANFETTKNREVYDVKKSAYVKRANTILDDFQEWLRGIDRRLIGHNVERGDIMRYVNGERQRKDTKEITGFIKSESKRLFNQYIQNGLDEATQKALAEKFNIEKNSYVRPDYHLIPVEISGMAESFHDKPFNLTPTQKNGIGFLVNKGSGLVAYGVGVGKTHTMLIATVASMQKGWTKRPLFIVPASTMEGWLRTTQQMFPGIKVNDLSGLQSNVVSKLKKGGEVSTWIKDGEISFITHEGILKLGFTPDEMYEATKDLQDALGAFDMKLSPREMEQSKEKTQEILGESLKGSTDIMISDLGIDHISVDEVHNFRKIFQGAKVEGEEGEKAGKRRFANVFGGTPSARGRKLFLISQHIQKMNEGRNVFLASATPFENHATEVYNILSLMARESMKRAGIYNINDFYAAFANFKTESIQDVSGKFVDKEVMMSFQNLGELQSLLKEFIDKKESSTVIRPDKVVLTPQLRMSQLQKDMKEKIRGMLNSKDDGVVLKATTYMKLNSFSPYFVEEFAPKPANAVEFVKNSPKIEYTMEALRAIKNNPKTSKYGNFLYIGAEGVGYTDLYVDYLTNNVGYAKDEIGVVTGETSIDDREIIKDKFNKGTIKVLIGGTPTKEGINLQENGLSTFILSLGWNPTEMAQVGGRVWRQGNLLNKVFEIYPLVENSGDINIYQKFEEKASRINDLFSYEGNVFDIGELDPKEKKLLLLTDPTEKANLSIKLDQQKLQNEKLYLESELSEIEKLKAELSGTERQLPEVESRVQNYKARLEEAVSKGEQQYNLDYFEKQVKSAKELVSEYKAKIKSIKKKFEERGIEPESKIQELKKAIEANTSAINDTKLQFEKLLAQYTNEYETSVKNTKSLEENSADLMSKMETVRPMTPEEIAAKKAEVAMAEGKEKEAILNAVKKKETVPEDAGERVSPAVKKRGGQNLNSLLSIGGISKFAKRETTQADADFKLSERVIEVIDKLKTNFTRYVSPGALGTFFEDSKNIALRSVNDISTVQHELSHFIDNKLGITASLMKPIRYTDAGFPIYDPKYRTERKLLTNIYVANYPGAKKTDKLKTRLAEGYAVLQQLFLENPDKAKFYKELYQKYIVNAHELQKQLNTDMAKIVTDYQSLDSIQKVDAVITQDLNKEGDSYLTPIEKVEEYMVNAILGFEKLDKESGLAGTPGSVANLLHGHGNTTMRTVKNLTEPGEGFWQLGESLEFEKITDDNFSSLVSDLGRIKQLPRFSTYLVARDQYFEWKYYDELKTQIQNAGDVATLSPSELQELKALIAEFRAVEMQLKNNAGILSRVDVTKTYTDLHEDFKDSAARFDTFVRADLKAMKVAGIISEERYNKLASMEGYAPMKRLIRDGILGKDGKLSGAGTSVKVSKISSLKQRTGGTHDIIDPLVSYGASHRETTLKAFKQIMMNKLFEQLQQFPQLAQRVPFKTINVDGRVSRILGNGKNIESDPNVIIKMKNGKPLAMEVSKEISQALEMILTPTERGGLEKFVVGSSRIFSMGTTGLYPLYALTNVTRDQQTALMNTQNNYNPAEFPKYAALTAGILIKDKLEDMQYARFIGPVIRKIAELLPNVETAEAKFLREYLALGGEYRTSLNFNAMSGEELLKAMGNEKNGLEILASALTAGLEILSLPANISEIATRAQEYVKARKSGKSQWNALEDAGRVSAPFHHKGMQAKNAFTRGSVASIPYLNASMQGTAQIISTFKRDGKGKFRVSLGITLIAAAMVASVLLALENSDDKTKEAFVNMDTGNFGKFIFFPKGDGEFVKIPIPQETGFLGALMEMMIVDAKHKAHYSTKEYADAMLAFLPDQLKVYDPAKMLLSMIPQLGKPSLEVIFNKTTFPSVRDLESQAQRMQSLPYRITPATSPMAIQLGQGPLKDILSPIQIDHLLNGYFGRTIGYLTGKPSAYNVQSPFTQPEYFTSGRIIQKFYDEYGPSGKLSQTMTSIKRGDIQSTDEQDRINYVKNKRAQSILDDLRSLKENEPNTPEFNAKREKIWKEVNDLLFDFDKESISSIEEQGFQRKEATAAWNVEKEELIPKYVQKMKEATDRFANTRIANELKKEIQGDAPKMTQSMQARYNSVLGKVKDAIAGENDLTVRAVTNATYLEDKQTILLDKRNEMLSQGQTNEDFRKYIVDLKKKGVVSDALFKKILISIK